MMTRRTLKGAVAAMALMATLTMSGCSTAAGGAGGGGGGVIGGGSGGTCILIVCL